MKPIRYKNATIEPHDYPHRYTAKYMWTHDEYEADLQGEDWVGNGGNGEADTIEECKEQIDEWLEEN